MTWTSPIARLRSIGRRILVGAAFLFGATLPPAAWTVGNLVWHMGAQMGAPPSRPLPTGAAPPAHDTRLKTAVVITGGGGAEMTDFLIPFEALATTEAFNMYVVAPVNRVIPLASAGFHDGGLDLVPHYAIDEFDRTVGVVPDLIVIPFLPRFATGEEAALVPWIRRHAARGALILSVCAGSEVLAATGVVDGRRATTHPNFFARLEATYPSVTWVRDVRFVEDERAISSGAIASGMDATLAAIRRLLGRPAAVRVARRLGYAHLSFLDAPAYPAGFDGRAMLAAAMSPLHDEVGVLLYDGVAETAASSIFDTYPTTLGTRVRSIGARPGIVRTKHGMQLLPRLDLAGALDVGRLEVPGVAVPDEIRRSAATWAASRGIEVVEPHRATRGFSYDATITDIARRQSRMAATAVAVNLNYPIDHLVLPGSAFPASVVAVPALLSIAGVLSVRRLRRRRRARIAVARATAAPAAGVSGDAFVDLPAGRVHYELAGPAGGPLVVLVHGNAGPMWVWDGVVAGLHQAGRRTLRYDLYGRGLSARPDAPHSRDLYDAQLVGLLDALGVHGPVDLVGTSQGGAVAVTFAARHPERVRRLALLAPIMDGFVAPLALRLARLPLVGKKLVEVLAPTGAVKRLGSLFAGGVAPEGFVRRFREQLGHAGFGRSIALNAVGDALGNHLDAYRRVAASGLPVLLAWGDRDRTITRDMIGRTRETLSPERYLELAGVGHVAQWERPELVANALRDFFQPGTPAVS